MCLLFEHVNHFHNHCRSAGDYKDLPRFQELDTEVQRGINADLDGLRREMTPYTFGTQGRRKYDGREASLAGFEGFQGYTKSSSQIESDWAGPGQPCVCKREFFTVGRLLVC